MTTKTVKLSLAIALVTLSGLSQATSAWHQGNGDIVHFTPEHIGQNTAKSPVDPNVHAKMLHGDSMTPEIVDNESIFPREEALKNSFVNTEKKPDTVKLGVRLWQQIKAKSHQ